MLALGGLARVAVPRWSPKVPTVPRSGRFAHGAAMSVGLVVVSHSRKLAEGLEELLIQVTQGRVRVAAAGGAEGDRLGSDALRIKAAIESVVGPDGVLVLMDLGSAVLATESALELFDPAVREGIRLADAPLVEGAIAAAVEASLGTGLEDVARAAESARAVAKLEGRA
jgi:dihydroxyacetone kinase phosphotransfer subunit